MMESTSNIESMTNNFKDKSNLIPILKDKFKEVMRVIQSSFFKCV